MPSQTFSCVRKDWAVKCMTLSWSWTSGQFGAGEWPSFSLLQYKVDFWGTLTYLSERQRSVLSSAGRRGATRVEKENFCYGQTLNHIQRDKKSKRLTFPPPSSLDQRQIRHCKPSSLPHQLHWLLYPRSCHPSVTHLTPKHIALRPPAPKCSSMILQQRADQHSMCQCLYS